MGPQGVLECMGLVSQLFKSFAWWLVWLVLYIFLHLPPTISSAQKNYLCPFVSLCTKRHTIICFVFWGATHFLIPAATT